MPKQKQKNTAGAPRDIHSPVMVQEVLSYLSPSKGETYLDLTAGYGGHAAAVMAAAGKLARVTLVDRDEQAARALTDRFSGNSSVQVLRTDFLAASQKLVNEGERYDMILADLGASSLHLDEPGRGFSFRQKGPLDMRMDQRQAVTADLLVNHSSQAELERMLATYGEEPRAKAIAARIVAARPVSSTEELALIIEKTVGRRFGRKKIHPATRSFQALRIAVNEELTQLEQSLPLWEELLAPGGRMAIISFHSLEDRNVKQYLSDHAGDRYDAELRLLTKKPATASRDEIALNPRARSAKLRAAAKIKTKKKG